MQYRLSRCQRDREIDKALSGINSYIRDNQCVGSIEASFYLEAIGKMFGEFTMSDTSLPEGVVYSHADRVPGNILVKCKSLEQLSENAKRVTLAFITQLYYHNRNIFEWLIENLSDNQSFILLLEEWLCSLKDYSEHTIHAIWEVITYLKSRNVRVDYHLFSQAVKTCAENSLLDRIIREAIKKARANVPIDDGIENSSGL